MKLVTSALTLLKNTLERDFGGNLAEAARALGISYQTLYSWLGPKASRTPTLRSLEPVLEKLGIEFADPQEQSGREVCFVTPRIVPAGEHASAPRAEDYMAAPLVGEVGAGPGYIPEDRIKSWFLVYRNLPAVRYRRNLIAVEIGRNSTSMEPLLHPGDIVLVDRDDRDVRHAGHIMLVRDPDGAGMIKRVAVEDTHNGDCRITFYSNDAVRHPPSVYSLRKDFYNDWERCIVGRVIWAWSDITDK